MMLSGWGRYPALECRTQILRDSTSVNQVIGHNSSLIARGNGRAYGDASLNSKLTVLTTKLDRFRAFDTAAGIIECEAGILLSDLLEVTVPRGWFPPVVPGTKFVTVGGLIAADVHGKNHHKDGSFGRYVESLRLAIADGTIIDCSRSANREIFDATIGGMGLTGIILSAKFRLRSIGSSLIEETTIRAMSLEALLELFTEHENTTYSVAWIDCLAEGPKSGRSILLLGEHADGQNAATQADLQARNRPAFRLSVPIELPASPLNKWSIKIFNEAYYALQKPAKRLRPYGGFFFPLDAIENWNRIYGRRGFIQYQCVIGGDDSERALRRILNIVRELGLGSFLAVLKKLGPGNRYMSFPMEGYTINLDFPVRDVTMTSMAKLDAIVAEHRGRIYLAKDSRTPRAIIEQGYPEIEAFRQLRRTIDPEQKFRSALSERLGL
jgi:decaprenylphospho-beta-D-ribofuranose 2-oxidase